MKTLFLILCITAISCKKEKSFQSKCGIVFQTTLTGYIVMYPDFTKAFFKRDSFDAEIGKQHCTH